MAINKGTKGGFSLHDEDGLDEDDLSQAVGGAGMAAAPKKAPTDMDHLAMTINHTDIAPGSESFGAIHHGGGFDLNKTSPLPLAGLHQPSEPFTPGHHDGGHLPGTIFGESIGRIGTVETPTGQHPNQGFHGWGSLPGAELPHQTGIGVPLGHESPIHGEPGRIPVFEDLPGAGFGVGTTVNHTPVHPGSPGEGGLGAIHGEPGRMPVIEPGPGLGIGATVNHTPVHPGSPGEGGLGAIHGEPGRMPVFEHGPGEGVGLKTGIVVEHGPVEGIGARSGFVEHIPPASIGAVSGSEHGHGETVGAATALHADQHSNGPESTVIKEIGKLEGELKHDVGTAEHQEKALTGEIGKLEGELKHDAFGSHEKGTVGEIGKLEGELKHDLGTAEHQEKALTGEIGKLEGELKHDLGEAVGARSDAVMHTSPNHDATIGSAGAATAAQAAQHSHGPESVLAKEIGKLESELKHEGEPKHEGNFGSQAVPETAAPGHGGSIYAGATEAKAGNEAHQGAPTTAQTVQHVATEAVAAAQQAASTIGTAAEAAVDRLKDLFKA